MRRLVLEDLREWIAEATRDPGESWTSLGGCRLDARTTAIHIGLVPLGWCFYGGPVL